MKLIVTLHPDGPLPSAEELGAALISAAKAPPPPGHTDGYVGKRGSLTVDHRRGQKSLTVKYKGVK
tara:strand:- start:14405 stop:14602 length:198 start_codon:yes stop_codon:yes gene_type:complete